MLRPGETLLSAAGKPYDTLEEVIGIAGEAGAGSLKDFGIGYKQVELKNGALDEEGILNAITPDVKLVLIQRSRGYDWRPSLSVDEIDRMIERIHAAHPGVNVMVDNCYGEFTGAHEPKADVFAGSLIKNPGGGLRPRRLYRRTRRVRGQNRQPAHLARNRRGGRLLRGRVSAVLSGLLPRAAHRGAGASRKLPVRARVREAGLRRTSEIRRPARRHHSGDSLRGRGPSSIRFIQSIQMDSPVDAEAVPEPWDMPGYQDQVIMAAGTFVSGASIELSADAPIRPPYIAYLQGGLTYAHGRIALEGALQRMQEA